MNEVVEKGDLYHIEATTSIANRATRVLKQGETFAIFNPHGDAGVFRQSHQGIFHEGTRFLSYLELRLGRDYPLLLSSTVKKDNLLLGVDLTNPDIYHDEQLILPQGTLHFFRSKFLWQGVCYERIKIENYSAFPVPASITLRFDADFVDIFEVRGTKRDQRGERLPAVVEAKSVVLGYRGLDTIVRRTQFEFSPTPERLSESQARFEKTLLPKEAMVLFISISFHLDDVVTPRLFYDHAFSQMVEIFKAEKIKNYVINTSNVQFNDWLDRSQVDLRMMISETPKGLYPYAGVPWYSTVFGRDGIITALECLWIDPEVAKGVLAFLAENQARELNSEQDAEPGKILHETRKGEMALLGEVPFRCYYGSVDSTPLFIMLAGAYFERTGDIAFIASIWVNIERALNWIDVYGDADGDGFVEYLCHSSIGLVNQGWKDSSNSMFHADGALAQGPIALCEVQAYVYAAKLRAAEIAQALGKPEVAACLKDAAQALQLHFEQVFWCAELGTYALALDGAKAPLRVRSSNAGHILFAGIASPERAAILVKTLLSEHSFSGWGIRTIAADEPNYNPMSYHNGSVWPHDNAIIAAGFARYGYKKEVLQIMGALFETSRYMDLNRLPELFCGFVRRPDEAPTLYPVACSPQAWAAGAAFLLLQSALGLSIRLNGKPQICFSYPELPEFLREVRIEKLKVGSMCVDISVRRYRDDVGVLVLDRNGEIEILVIK